MKVFGIAGHSGMGKTTILEKLIPEFSRRYLTVSLIKHSHKNIDIDKPGKDSFRLRESGCKEVLLLGNDRWALMHELRGDLEPDLQYLLSRLQQCDLVLIEGFKQGGFPKLEVWRDIQNKNTLWPKLLDITAIASDRNIPLVEIPQFLLEDIEGIAKFILSNAMLFNKSTDPVLAKGDLNFD